MDRVCSTSENKKNIDRLTFTFMQMKITAPDEIAYSERAEALLHHYNNNNGSAVDDSDDEDFVLEEQHVKCIGVVGSFLLFMKKFVSSLVYTMLGITGLPMLLIWGLFSNGKTKFPSKCRGPWGFMLHCVMNAIVLFGLCNIAYFVLCENWVEFTMEDSKVALTLSLDVFRSNMVHILHLQPMDVLTTIVKCTALFIIAQGFISFYQKWTRYFVLCSTILCQLSFKYNVIRLFQHQPTIVSLDPNYALINESIAISIQGHHLNPQSTIAWVPYWGSDLEFQEKLFPAPFENGMTQTTFLQIDEFIPCYQQHPIQTIVQPFHCYPNLRIKVKDAQSIPGLTRLH